MQGFTVTLFESACGTYGFVNRNGGKDRFARIGLRKPVGIQFHQGFGAELVPPSKNGTLDAYQNITY